jgi:superfamily I DNA and/or RNA helicase
MKREAKTLQSDKYERELLQNAKIVIATLSQVGKSLYSDLHFDLIIYDEGAQTVETTLAQALRRATHTVVSICDNHQLQGSPR